MARPQYHPLAQLLARVPHEESVILAITLLIHWLKGCPEKMWSYLKLQRPLKVLKAMRLSANRTLYS